MPKIFIDLIILAMNSILLAAGIYKNSPKTCAIAAFFFAVMAVLILIERIDEKGKRRKQEKLKYKE